MRKEKGFTLIEILVAIAIIAILIAIIIFSILQYINKSRDATITGTLSSLVPTGEVYYDHNNGNGYGDANADCISNKNSFCCSSAFENANSSVYLKADSYCKSGGKPVICCKATSNAWAACALEFTDSNLAFCVDSIGHKKTICKSSCTDKITVCPDDECY